MSAKKDPSKGAAVVLGQDLGVTLSDGHTYALRRLDVRDTFKLARIVMVGITAIEGGMQNFDGELKGEHVQTALLAALPHAEKEIADAMGSLLGLSADEFLSLPPEAPIEIAAVLAEHQDLSAFFTSVGRLMGALPEMRTRSRGRSSPSKKASLKATTNS